MRPAGDGAGHADGRVSDLARLERRARVPAASPDEELRPEGRALTQILDPDAHCAVRRRTAIDYAGLARAIDVAASRRNFHHIAFPEATREEQTSQPAPALRSP